MDEEPDRAKKHLHPLRHCAAPFKPSVSSNERHPRITEPAMQVLDGPLYLHQLEINTKNVHDGEVWHWHQDYRTWFEDGGMPKPRIINAALLLDGVTEFSGPTMFVPSNQKFRMILSDKIFDHIPEYGNPQKVRWAVHKTMRPLTASSASTASSPQKGPPAPSPYSTAVSYTARTQTCRPGSAR